MPFGTRFFQYLNIIDQPDHRKRHELPTPGTGGIIFFIPFGVLFIFFTPLTPEITAYLISVSFLVFIGLTDDISPISPYSKFFAQLLSAFIFLSLSRVYLDLPFFTDYPQIQFILSLFFITGITNSMNLIDGLDGLAAGLSIISLSMMGMFMTDTPYLPMILLIIGSVFGFLRANTFPAMIFMGDSGSYFLGFSIAVFSLLGVSSGSFPVWYPLAVALIPMADTIAVFIRRLINGKNVFMPDNSHIHYRLRALGISHKNTVFLLYSLQMLTAFLAIGALVERTSTFWFSFFILIILTLQHVILIFRDDLKMLLQKPSGTPLWFFQKYPILKRAYVFYFLIILIAMAGYQILHAPIQPTENIVMIFIALITTYLFVVDHNKGRSSNVSIGMLLLAGLSAILSRTGTGDGFPDILIYLLIAGVILSVFGLYRNHHIFDSPTEYLLIIILVMFSLFSSIIFTFSVAYYLILIYLVYKILLQDPWVRRYNIIYILNMTTLILFIIRSLP